MRVPLLSLLALLSACSVVNRDHCGNQDGDATCSERDASRPFCSVCVADNDGCLAQAPTAECAATSAAPGSTGPGSSTDPAAPTTGTGTTAATTGSSSTTGADTTTTAGTTEPDTGPDTTSDTTTGTTEPGTTGTTEPDTTTGTTGTTASDPVCGNDVQEGEEVCDGADKADKTCATLLPEKWGGGQLACNECMSFNDSACCIGVGQLCDPLKPEEACCGGLECTMDLLKLEWRCQNP